MRTVLVAVVLSLVLSGCLVEQKAAQPPTVVPHGWVLDCDQGSYERARNASWAQVCEARGSHTVGPKEETWAGINPTDPLNVIVGVKDLNPDLSANCVWNGLSVTHDGGKSWKDVSIGGKYADRKPTDPWYGYACNTDPDFRFTKDGAVHYGVEVYNLGSKDANGLVPDPTGLAGNTFKIILATSHDGGDTWPDVIVFQPDLLVVTDYSRMTVDPVTQAIIEAIGSDDGGRCHVLVSTDGGKTARPPVDVETKEGAPCNSGAGTAIAVSPKGIVTLVGGQVGYQGDPVGVTYPSTPDAQPIVARSSDDGLTWSDSNPGFSFKPIGSFKESKYRVGSVIELAYDLTSGPCTGTLYASYTAADRDEADIFVRSSKDDGRTWSDAVMVNDDSAGPHQWMANVAVAGDGSVHVFYMDKRYDPAHKLIDLTHAVSLDGGRTWTDERVSTLSYDGDLGVHQNKFPFIGDYLGVDAVGTEVWAGFPDASNGRTTVVAAAHVHNLGGGVAPAKDACVR